MEQAEKEQIRQAKLEREADGEKERRRTYQEGTCKG